MAGERKGGKFQKGQPRPAGAGRTTGVPNHATAEVKALARQYGPQAINLLAQLAGFIEGQPPSENDQCRLAAGKEILDRAYGKAVQPFGNDDGEPIIVNIVRYADRV